MLLESGTAGIDTFCKRRSRKLDDKKLVKKLRTSGINKFMEGWLNQPMFKSIKQVMLPSEYEEFAKIKTNQNEVGLANSLLGFGTGSMPNFWKKLKNIRVHTLLITEISAMRWIKCFDFKDIIYEKADGIAKITINRPEVRNAFRPETVKELLIAFHDAKECSDVGVILLTGAGPASDGKYAFCSGGDQRIRANKGYVGEDDGVARLNVLDLQKLIRSIPKVVIALVAGYAIGGGHVLHVVCDLTIAAENAIFGQTGPKVGSFDGGFGASYLARIVGQKKAREIWYLCMQYDANEALKMGLINKIVPISELESEGISWANKILAHSPLAIRCLKSAFNAELDGQAGIQELAGTATLLYYMSEEAPEGKNAYLEKRKPEFKKFTRIKNASDLNDDYKSVIIKVDKTSYNGKVYSSQGNAFIGFDEKSYTGQIITIEKKPYNEIYNWQDLQAINFKLDGHYVLKNDINIPKPNINGFPASGFKTIASDTNNTIDGFQGFSFTGSLDGNGFKINNLIIVNSDNDYVGMFGRVSNARFTNIRCNVDSIIGRLYVGGLCGSSQNSVFSKVEVTNGKIISSQNSVGGIIGNAVGGYIKNAFSNSEVYGSSRVGGLIGACEADSLADSYFTGSVFTTIREGGGIAGYNTSKVYKCYSTATQKTPSAVNYESFIGKNEGGTIRQSYWEKDPSGFSLSFFAIYVTNRTRISFLNNKFYDTGQNNLELFIGWDFNSTWLNKGNGSFPTLRWQ
ncbi:hypothetical protein CHS0354_000597 [Potamilus streckersoni]|uniref:1,4-dihydroxy-2-naphthoyl-CoA synthase n=1 Tax=Potamilus streckersoni TaxID=2493646 RepID=A0AAE0W7G5_9BIVA|nr:hypothetical protein CHS0354_000597 [Potamilus streckersoni]